MTSVCTERIPQLRKVAGAVSIIGITLFVACACSVIANYPKIQAAAQPLQPDPSAAGPQSDVLSDHGPRRAACDGQWSNLLNGPWKPSISYQDFIQKCMKGESSDESAGDRAIAYNNRGKAYGDKGDQDSAIAEYTQAIQLNPNYALAYYNRGKAYSDKGDTDRAIADYTQAIRLNPNEFAYANRGVAYGKKDDYDSAIADFTQAIKLNPSYAEAYNNRGISYLIKGDLARGIADLTQAIQLDPKDSAAYQNRGNAYRAMKNYDNAIADYTAAIQLNPNFALAYGNRGIAYYSGKGDYDRAIADYTKAIQLNPRYARAYESRALAYNRTGDYDYAIADYTQAIQLDPKDAIAYDNRGNAYRAKYDYDHAMADYAQAIQINPMQSGTYFDRALAYLYSGALSGALADLNQSSVLDPKSAYTALWLYIVDKRSGLPDRLAEATGQIDMSQWPAPIIQFFLGRSTPEAALAAANNADPNIARDQTCEANFYTGEVELQRGGKKQATRLFRTAANICPRSFLEHYGAAAELKALDPTR